ncbi:alpha/beta hydrolase [Pelagicoccus sp. SDUM812002]|uniref:alpha/beta hydrolase n=1 Tax=Pelagicoccus sp. SDUM812002 TaxID=3041266 RepID=UPI00280C9647|nr:alpha/beta hydrolase [Pelagicoccus sp. SDUM812002]MDQ8188282.1 alpha/beta hydrolase [Pelagicoccus sp. SDUM812002]
MYSLTLTNPIIQPFLLLLRLVGTAFLSAIFMQGCARFETLRSDIADWEQSSRIAVSLEGDPSIIDGAYAAVWTRGQDGDLEIQDLQVSGPDGRLAFLLRDKQDYFFGAFQDRNENSKVDVGEPLWFYGDEKPRPVPHGARSVQEINFLKIERKEAIHLPTLEDLRTSRDGRALFDLTTDQSVKIIAGEIADLDDPRFAIEVGDQGLWEPTRFMRNYGVGVFFLQEYDASKMPLIFVSGASGTPRNWQWIVERLDKTRFQPWVFHYPSGLSLEETSHILDLVLNALYRKHGFSEIGVVAHSMGGLLARNYILVAQSRDYEIAGFVSLSTPWNGHYMAKLGVDYAPEAIPSWKDIEPDSEFIEMILEAPMPVEHLLVYGNASNRSPFLPKENDGTVSVESMLDPRAVEAATNVIELPKNHIDILKSHKARKAIELLFSE